MTTSSTVPDSGDERIRRRAIDRLLNVGLPPDHPAVAVARALLREYESVSTVRRYARILSAFLSFFALEGVDPLGQAIRPTIRAWWTSTAGYAAMRRRAYLYTVRRFYRQAGSEGLFLYDPTFGIRAPKLKSLADRKRSTPALTQDQVLLLLGAIEAELSHPDRRLHAVRDLLAINLMMRLGLRSCEVASLTWSSFVPDYTGGVDQFGDPAGYLEFSSAKGGDDARLYVPGDVWRLASTVRLAYGQAFGRPMADEDPVIVSFKGTRLGFPTVKPLPHMLPTTISARIVADRLYQIGLPKRRRYAAHCLRATAITLAHESGASLNACRLLARHATLEMTQFYVKRDDVTGRAAAEAIKI